MAAIPSSSLGNGKERIGGERQRKRPCLKLDLSSDNASDIIFTT